MDGNSWVQADIEERIGRSTFWEVSLKRGGCSQAVRDGLVDRVVGPNSDMLFWGMEQSSPQDAKLTILTSNIRLA